MDYAKKKPICASIIVNSTSIIDPHIYFLVQPQMNRFVDEKLLIHNAQLHVHMDLFSEFFETARIFLFVLNTKIIGAQNAFSIFAWSTRDRHLGNSVFSVWSIRFSGNLGSPTR